MARYDESTDFQLQAEFVPGNKVSQQLVRTRIKSFSLDRQDKANRWHVNHFCVYFAAFTNLALEPHSLRHIQVWSCIIHFQAK